MRTACAVLLMLVIVLGVARGASAQGCDRTLMSESSDANGYSLRKNDTRCEGIIVSPVGGDDIDLVSLTYGQFSEALLRARQTPAPTLKVAITSSQAKVADELGKANADQRVHLRAVGIPVGLYYRLDADLAPDNKYQLNWPLTTIKNVGIGDDQVGVLAYKPDDVGEPVYFPVHLSASDGSKPVVAVLRAETPIEAVEWCFGTPSCEAEKWQPAPIINGGEVIIEIAQIRSGGSLHVQWTDSEDGKRHMQSLAIVP